MIKMFFDKKDDVENARCGKCKRILFKKMSGSEISGIEIKCHSCKEINYSDDDAVHQFTLSTLSNQK